MLTDRIRSPVTGGPPNSESPDLVIGALAVLVLVVRRQGFEPRTQ
jgi:hypothetical protein